MEKLKYITVDPNFYYKDSRDQSLLFYKVKNKTNSIKKFFDEHRQIYIIKYNFNSRICLCGTKLKRYHSFLDIYCSCKDQICIYENNMPHLLLFTNKKDAENFIYHYGPSNNSNILRDPLYHYPEKENVKISIECISYQDYIDFQDYIGLNILHIAVCKYFYYSNRAFDQVYYSQPTKGLSIDDIIRDRLNTERLLKYLYDNKFCIINNLQFLNTNSELYRIAYNIKLISDAKMVVFSKDWKLSDECIIEHYLATNYLPKEKIVYL